MKMNFEKLPTNNVRARKIILENEIRVTKGTISFGTHQPAFDYAEIEIDVTNKLIRFIPKLHLVTSSRKVLVSNGTGLQKDTTFYYLSTRALHTTFNIPKGMYRLLEDEPFIYRYGEED